MNPTHRADCTCNRCVPELRESHAAENQRLRARVEELERDNELLKRALDGSQYEVMRALMVVVHDECISSDRAREIAGMTHEEQRQFWRDEHKQAIREAIDAAREGE